MIAPKKEAPPEKKRSIQNGCQSMNEPNSATDSQQRRQLELLCFIARGLTELGDKLDDLSVLNQQQTDLLRRLIQRSERAL